MSTSASRIAAGLLCGFLFVQTVHAQTTGQVDPKIARQAMLDQLINTIRNTDNASTALSAYAKGTGLDARNSELNNVYMKRMLKLGLPQMAMSPAQVLTVDEPTNHLAWAVLGYCYGKKNDPLASLASTLRAMEGLSKDASLLNNTGQLLAWYDAQKIPPALPDASRRIMDKYRDAWAKEEPFDKAYKRVGAVMQERVNEQKDQLQKIEQTAKALDDLKKKVLDYDSALKDANNDVKHHKDMLASLRYEYWLRYEAPNIQPPVYDTGTPYGYRTNLLVRIKDEEHAVKESQTKADQILADGRQSYGDYLALKKTLDAMTQKTAVVDVKLQRTFRWDPPSLDGVMTPEVESFPQPGSKPSASMPRDPEADAQRKIELARLYLVNDMTKKAREILQDIVTKNAGTKAAKEAKTILEKLPADDSK